MDFGSARSRLDELVLQLEGEQLNPDQRIEALEEAARLLLVCADALEDD